MKIDYKKIYKKAAKMGGWSSGKPDRFTSWGDIYENLSKTLTGKEKVLDLGTAEGKNFLRLAEKIEAGVGIDIEPEMIRLARKNAKHFSNMKFIVMDAHKLSFSANSFDIVTCRQSTINLKQVYRVLKPKGILVTQQIHEADKINIKKAFGRGQDFGIKPGSRLKKYRKEALKLGFIVTQAQVSNKPFYFKNKLVLEKHLKIAPLIDNFGSKKDYEILEKFIQKNKTKKGIKSNSARFLLVLEKRIR